MLASPLRTLTLISLKLSLLEQAFPLELLCGPQITPLLSKLSEDSLCFPNMVVQVYICNAARKRARAEAAADQALTSPTHLPPVPTGVTQAMYREASFLGFLGLTVSLCPAYIRSSTYPLGPDSLLSMKCIASSGVALLSLRT